jgi:antitoxin component of MazEF toxin-antitoxin module
MHIGTKPANSFLIRKVGRDGAAIAAPRDWLKANGLQHGDRVYLTIDSEGRLVAEPVKKELVAGV